jgi:hypothetical protein
MLVRYTASDMVTRNTMQVSGSVAKNRQCRGVGRDGLRRAVAAYSASSSSPT